MFISNTLFLDFTDISDREKNLATEKEMLENQIKSDIAGMLVYASF